MYIITFKDGYFTGVLHNYRHVIIQSIDVRQSIFPNLPHSLSPIIVFHFLHPFDEAASPLKNGILLFALVHSKHLVCGYVLPRAEW